MSTTPTHMSASVRALLQMTDRELDGILTIGDEPASGSKAREELTRALNEGQEVIPFCAKDQCPDFDYSGGGCPGHPAREGTS